MIPHSVKRRCPLILALALGALAAAPLLLGSGFLNTRAGGDSPFLLFRLHQLYSALAEGVFPVRWMPDAAYGLGYPFFSYYAALPYYLAAVFKGLGFSFVASLKLAQLVGFLLAAGAMFAWVRRRARSAWSALLASAAYTFAPFHMVNVYVRGDSLSEFWAFAWYPLILFAADRFAERVSAARAAGLALAYAALALTHNISWFIFTPFLLLYVLLVGVRRATPARAVRAFGVFALALALGLLLSAWFWLPSVGELNLVQLAASTTGYFHYSNHFREDDLVQHALVFNYDIDPAAQTTPFSMGAAQFWMAVGGAAALSGSILALRRRGEPVPARFVGFLALGLVLSLFLMTPGSRFLWDRLPLLPVVQFPWRFLSAVALFSAALTGYLVDGAALLAREWAGSRRLRSAADRLPRAFARVDMNRASPALVALGLSAALAVSALPGLRLDFIPLTDHDITPERLQLYEYFTGNIGTTIRYEWLPNTVNPRPYAGPDLLGLEPRPKPLSGEAHGARLERHAAWQRWAVSVESESATLALPLHGWSGWRAAADGRPVEVSAAPGLGWVTLTLPRGEHTVTLWLDRTPIRALAELLSLLGLVVALILLRRALRAGARALAANPRPTIAVAAMLAVLGVGLRIFPEAPLTGPLTMDFARQAYLYHAPGGVDFGGGVRLRDYQYRYERDTPCLLAALLGEWDTAVYSADALVPALALPAVNALNIPVVVAGGYRTTLAPHTDAALAPPCPLAPGVYLPTLVVLRGDEPMSARTDAGEPRGTLTLAPIVHQAHTWADAGAEPIAMLAPGLSLLDAKLEAGNPNLLLTWRADAEIARNYHIGLRLRDAAGNLWAEQDAPLGLYGAYPPALWLPGERVAEAYWLPLPPGMPPARDYQLQISVYDAATGEAAGEADVTGLEKPGASFISPDAPRRFRPITALSIGDLVAPATVVQGEPFTLVVRWIAEADLREDYRARWGLRAVDGREAWSTETPLAPGAEPSAWTAGMWVEGRLRLDPPATLPPGAYTLTLTLLDAGGAALHSPLPVGEWSLEPAPAPTGAPEGLPNRVNVDFGGVIRLWGYAAEQTADALTLTLTWGALAETGADYTFFVHLFDPDTEAIPAQADAMPRAYTHPTSAWVPGEIVTDTVSLDLRAVPSGAYRVAVGWYDAAGRLPAFDAQGARLAGDRAILPLTVTIPKEPG